MSGAPRAIGGAVLTGLGWAAVWAPVAVLIGLMGDPDGSMDEMWLAIGAYPGFLCGLVFSAARAIAGSGRGLAGLSLVRAGVLGAASGLVVGVLPALAGTTEAGSPQWLPVLVVGSVSLLSAASAVATAGLFRRAAPGRLPAGVRSEG